MMEEWRNDTYPNPPSSTCWNHVFVVSKSLNSSSITEHRLPSFSTFLSSGSASSSVDSSSDRFNSIRRIRVESSRVQVGTGESKSAGEMNI